MPIYDKDDTFLARWLNEELTEAELKAFEQSSEYADFKAITENATDLKVPTYDQDAAWSQLQQATKEQSGPTAAVVRRLPMWRAIAAAVALLLIAGATWYWTGYTTVQTLAQQQQEVLLPDGSTVVLNSQSSVTYNRRTWNWQREVELQGEGFFVVEKGERFTVQTENGQVEVLGTSFNVYDRSNALEVHCLTGKVAVTAAFTATSVTLQPQEAIRFQGGRGDKLNFTTENAPAWQNGQSKYQEVPLSRVLDDLEYQFGIQITRTNIDQARLFTGTFLHNELDVALDMVLAPMGIRYERNGEQIYLR